MVGILQVEAQPALDIVGACPKADETDIVLERLLEGRIQQEEIAAGDIVFQAEAGGKLEMIIPHHSGAAGKLSVLVDFDPGAIDHGEVLE